MWLVVIFCMLIGLIIGFQLPIFIPLVYAKYMSVAILAMLDSVLAELEPIWRMCLTPQFLSAGL